MTVHAAIEAGYTHAETAGGWAPLENMTYRADLSFDGSRLVADWAHIGSPDEGYKMRGIYPLKKEQ